MIIKRENTFEKVAAEWLIRKTAGQSYSYATEIENSVAHLISHLGIMMIREINWIDIEDLLLSRSRNNPNTNKPASKKLICDIKNTAYSIFEYAIDKKIIENNPVRNRKPPKCQPQKERRSLTEIEQKLLLSTEHRARLGAAIMMLAGLRTGELIPLTWHDFDEKKCVININKSVHRVAANKYELKPGTKNGKNRVVSIPIELSTLIKDDRENSRSPFITSKVNGDLHTPSSWKQMWNSYCKKMNFVLNNNNTSYFNPKGIPTLLDKITPHMLRHTYATLLYSSGVEVLTASKLLGHNDIKTTLAIYTHLEEMTEERSINLFNDYISEKLFA